MKKWLVTILILLILIYAAVGRGLTVSNYTLAFADLPSNFNNFKIVQISDLHCAYFGAKQEVLLAKIKQQQPDIIVFTGDMVDKKHQSTAALELLLAGLQDVAPVFAIQGNHDRWDDEKLYRATKELLARYHVMFLENAKTVITKDGQSINLLGINDPAVWDDSVYHYSLDDSLQEVGIPTGFNIALFHRANMFPSLQNKGLNLVLSGHLHGGHIRLPFVGGVVSPYLALWPKYDKGVFWENGTALVVSAGLGGTVSFPPRLFNPAELVTVTLTCK